MNIDAALRYLPVADALKKHQDQSPVLEVGSGTNGISDFYSGKVWGVDTNFDKTRAAKNPHITHKHGSILKIPFKDGEFSNVVCLDVFEHVPIEDRQRSIQELLRVLATGGTLYLGFPTGNWSLWAERVINSLYKWRFKKDHIWLIEHKQLGLPHLKTIIDQIKSDNQQVLVQKQPNVNIFFWVIMHLFYTVLSGSKLSPFLERCTPNMLALGRFLQIPPFYRIILIIKK